MPTLDELARAGIAAINEKRFDEAVARFREALAIDPNRPDLNSALGMAYLHRGEVASAIPHLEQAVALAAPYDAPEHQEMRLHFQVGLATAYELADRMADARRTLEDAAAKWPDAVEPRIQLGQLLFGSCALDEGVRVYDALASHPGLDEERQEVAAAVAGAVRAFLDSDQPASVFLQAHADTYRQYFDEVARPQVEQGWYAEAARMARGPDGDVRPFLAEGARPYAMTRVDLVNPRDGNVAEVHNPQEPHVVALNGLEPLAQLPVMLPWRDFPFEVWVCSRSPWHWLPITVQFAAADAPERLDADLDATFGEWYLAGFNGEFGERDSGRFHYVTDPELVGDRAITYVVDLGRARYDAIEALMRRLVVLHSRRPIRRVMFGPGHLPD